MHPTIPHSEYKPVSPEKFHSVPDPRTNAVLTDEILAADNYVREWASTQDKETRASINRFYNPPSKDVMPAYSMVQADGIEAFFPDTSESAQEAANFGTNPVRFAMSTMLPATGPGPDHKPVAGQIAAPAKTSGTNAVDSYPVSHRIVGSLYKWRIDCAQRHLNKGG